LRKIEYKASVDRDLRRLDRQVAARIIDKIEQELTSADLRPIPLSGSFEGLYKFRVGDYRVVYALSEGSILVIRVAHRREAYRQAKVVNDPRNEGATPTPRP
jgi:addiction module toxin, RelE/StbE family